jgi:hypothetical protein
MYAQGAEKYDCVYLKYLVINLYSVSPEKYPYNNRILFIEGTFFWDTLYSWVLKKRNLGISQEIDIVLKTKDFRVLGI